MNFEVDLHKSSQTRVCKSSQFFAISSSNESLQSFAILYNLPIGQTILSIAFNSLQFASANESLQSFAILCNSGLCRNPAIFADHGFNLCKGRAGNDRILLRKREPFAGTPSAASDRQENPANIADRHLAICKAQAGNDKIMGKQGPSAFAGSMQCLR